MENSIGNDCNYSTPFLDKDWEKSELIDKNMNTKLWKPLRKLYRQNLIISLLEESERNKVLEKTISVLNIATSFFCKKANKSALIEVSENNFDYACPECIADSTKTNGICNITKLKILIKYLKENNGLQLITFVGHGEPLEKDGNREITMELIKYAHDCGIIPLVYTGGHSLDNEIIDFLKNNNVCVLLSTYGLPFLKSDIFDPSGEINFYSEKKYSLDGRVLLASQKELVEKIYNLFKIKQSNKWETNLAISVVCTPKHFSSIENMNKLRLFTSSAKSNGFAVYAWEEFRKGMDKLERKNLEEKSRKYSGWSELGSLYVWNRCLFGTGGSVTILGDGDITHCPHTIQSAGFTIEDIVNNQGICISSGVERLLKKAHQFDHLSCIIRNTKLGERLPANVPLENIIGDATVEEFIESAFAIEFPYISQILQKSNAILKKSNEINGNLCEKLKVDYLWDRSLVHGGSNNKYFLSSALRYIYDSMLAHPLWDQIVSATTGHVFHNNELTLLNIKKDIFNIINGEALIFFGLGKKEDIIMDHLERKNIDIFLVDTRKKMVYEKKEKYEKKGFHVHCMSCFFENVYDKFFGRSSEINKFNSYTLVILGCTVGNFKQKSFWNKVLDISNNKKRVQVIVSLQVINSVENEDEIKKLNEIYDNKIFRSFISKPIVNEVEEGFLYEETNGSEHKLSFTNSISNKYDYNVEEHLGGVVSKVFLNNNTNWNSRCGKKIKLNKGSEIELYRSLKPDKNSYIRFLRDVLGYSAKISILAEYKDIVLYEILIENS